MKLLISFNATDLDQSIEIAHQVADHADIFTIGSLLINTYGVTALERFKEAFPKKELYVEAHILDHPKDTVTLFSKAGATYISVMAGASSHIIQITCTTARSLGTKMIIDLADANSVGQAALEAQRLGATALSIHKPTVEEDRVPFVDLWEMVKGNTHLPLYISAHISRENVGDVLGLEPSGIIIGSSITQAKNPQEEAAYFAKLLKK